MGQRILYIFIHFDLDCIRLHTYFENLVLKNVETKRLTFFFFKVEGGQDGNASVNVIIPVANTEKMCI